MQLGHHDVVGCYDVDVFVEIEHELQIIKVNLQHWTSRQQHVILHIVCLACRCVG